jgi:hypothetical protein
LATTNSTIKEFKELARSPLTGKHFGITHVDLMAVAERGRYRDVLITGAHESLGVAVKIDRPMVPSEDGRPARPSDTEFSISFRCPRGGEWHSWKITPADMPPGLPSPEVTDAHIAARLLCASAEYLRHGLTWDLIDALDWNLGIRA